MAQLQPEASWGLGQMRVWGMGDAGVSRSVTASGDKTNLAGSSGALQRVSRKCLAHRLCLMCCSHCFYLILFIYLWLCWVFVTTRAFL